MLLAFIAIVLGLATLVWSSDKFVEGAASIAESFGVSTLMVGLTVVAFGTSAPEILVSGFASATGSPGLAIGNAIGSNIANIGLVLSFTSLIVAVPVHPIAKKQDLSVYIGVVILVGLIFVDGEFAQFEGASLIIALIIISTLMVKTRSKITDPALITELEGLPLETDSDEHEVLTRNQALFAFFIGLVMLLVSSRLLVWGAVTVAQAFGVSKVIIGLTIIAVGTSLPELAATLTSALKGHHDLAIGNILGSNILNMLAVLPLPGLIAPGALEAGTFSRDFAVMALLSALMFVFIYLPREKEIITRSKGIVLLGIYATYIGYLVKISI